MRLRQPNMLCLCDSGVPCRRRALAGDAAEHSAGHQAGTARIVEIEYPAHELAGRIQAWNWIHIGINHLAAIRVDSHAAEGERQPAADLIALERRLLDGVRPVRLVDLEAHGRAAVLDVRIE